MYLTWPVWILVICVAASFACIVVGAIIAARAFARFSKHLDRTSSEAAGLVNAQRLQSNLVRITSLIDGIKPLGERSLGALGEINAALAELRLPQAALALRTAGAAVRLLFSGR
jgi:hypothetical protein